MRTEFLSADPERGKAFIGKGEREILLILGGSQGAETINKIVRESLAELSRHFGGSYLRPWEASRVESSELYPV